MPKNIFLTNDSFVNLAIFFLFAFKYRFCLCFDSSYTELVPELLLKLSDTLHKQYRYIDHVHEDISCRKTYTAYKT